MVKWAESLSQEEVWTVRTTSGKSGQPYLGQIVGGIMMSQGEVTRLNDIGLSNLDLSEFQTKAVHELSSKGNTQQARSQLVDIGAFG